MRGNPVKEPWRIGSHIAGAVELLREIGATDIRVFKTKHVAIVFRAGRHELTVRASCTPADEHDSLMSTRQAIRRELAKALGARA